MCRSLVLEELSTKFKTFDRIYFSGTLDCYTVNDPFTVLYFNLDLKILSELQCFLLRYFFSPIELSSKPGAELVI